MDMRAFNRWAGHRGLIRRGTFDAGYALHVLLSATFGQSALQPFRLFAPSRGRTATLYAYSKFDATALKRIAQDVGTPDCLGVVKPSVIQSKAMPMEFAHGRRLAFDVRVRPVRRLRNGFEDSQSGRAYSKGAEVDAFFLNAVRLFPAGGVEADKSAAAAGETREVVYGKWLAERFGEAARIEECRLAAFSRSRTLRGDGVGPEGPDATLHGVLRVTTPERFPELLRKGVGRHKAFGFGMLLLRPNSSRPGVEAAAAIAVTATATIPQLGFIHEDPGQCFCLTLLTCTATPSPFLLRFEPPKQVIPRLMETSSG